MATAKSTTERPPRPYSRQARYQAAVELLREKILPNQGDIFEFSGTQVEEDRELFTLAYLRSCIRLPVPSSLSPPPPPRRPPRLKHVPVRELTVHSSPKGCPFIRLAGRWVEMAGFYIGDKVSVKIEEGRLIVELLEADCDEDSEEEIGTRLEGGSHPGSDSPAPTSRNAGQGQFRSFVSKPCTEPILVDTEAVSYADPLRVNEAPGN